MYKLSQNVIHKVVKDKILLVELDNNSNTLLEIVGVSVSVFLGLLNGESESVIIERICAEYNTNHEQVTTDVNSFISSLVERKILLKG